MTTTWDFIPKPSTASGGWNFNEAGYSFNQAFDPNTGGIVYFNGQGTTQTYSNQIKN